MRKLSFIFVLIFLLVRVVYSQEGEKITENIVLDDLKALVEIYKEGNLPEAFPMPKGDKMTYAKKNYQYGERLSPIHRSVINFYKKYSAPAKENLDDKYTRIGNILKPITPKSMLDYFSELIIHKGFKFKTGDIILMLPHSSFSYHYAYLVDDAYSHGDILFIDPKDNVPYVLMLREGLFLQKVPLVKALLGMGEFTDRFAIYRYNKQIDEDELEYFLLLNSRKTENIYFDSFYYRDTLVKDPEKFFMKPRFYYCMEYIYMVYQYVLKNSSFDPHINYYNQYMITTKTFSASKDFSLVAMMGGNTPLNELDNEEIVSPS